MFHTIFPFDRKVFKALQTGLFYVLAISTAAHAQYPTVENLQDELLCRSAVRACLKSVSCSEGGKSNAHFCWQNQCGFKSHLTVGFGGVLFPVKMGAILKSSVPDPFELDFNAPIVGSHIVDCKDPAMAKAIVKIQRPEAAKPTLAPIFELAVQK